MKNTIKTLGQVISGTAVLSMLAFLALSIDRANATQNLNPILISPTDVILPKPDVKVSGWWEDWVTPNIDRSRKDSQIRV